MAVNKQLMIKIAQINKAARHVLNKRAMQKAAEDPSVIQQLKKNRDRSMLMDILGGVGIGGLLGVGFGAGMTGKEYIRLTKLRDRDIARFDARLPEYYKQNGDTSETRARAAEGRLKELASWNDYIKGSVRGRALYGIIPDVSLGALIGGLYRGLTHNYRKQKAIKQLKELGIESNEY